MYTYTLVLRFPQQKCSSSRRYTSRPKQKIGTNFSNLGSEIVWLTKESIFKSPARRKVLPRDIEFSTSFINKEERETNYAALQVANSNKSEIKRNAVNGDHL